MKQTLRRLMRTPGFTALTLATLAMGIGANSAIFSVVDGVLLKPLPYPEPDRLVDVCFRAPGLNIDKARAAPSTYFIFREQSRTFEDIGLWSEGAMSLTGTTEPEHLLTAYVTGGILPMLGAKPVLGRLFTEADDTPGSPDTIILTYGYWTRRHGGDRSIVGKQLILDGNPQEVIGVLPETFKLPDSSAQVILPMRLNRSETFLGRFAYKGIARLKPGVTLEQASRDVARMIPLTLESFPPPVGFSLQVFKESRFAPNLRLLKQDVVGDIGSVLWVVMGTIGLVLLIACANVSNLVLVRAEGRQNELMIRAALGAGRARIARELLLESMVLGLGGGALGIGVASAALKLLVWLEPSGLPRLSNIAIDTRVLVFTLAVSLVTSVLFGLLPVLRYTQPRLGVALRASNRTLGQSRERQRIRSLLVVVQVALALVLLVGSGLMIQTFHAMRSVQPGFVLPDEVQIVRVDVPGDAGETLQAQQAIMERLQALPGVESVGLSHSVMLDYYHDIDPIFIEDRTYEKGELPPIRRYRWVGPGYFRTLGTVRMAGRDLEWADQLDRRRVVLVSENLAREYWGSPDAAIGKRVRENAQGEWREIVGVMANEQGDGVDLPAPAVVYLPMLVEGFRDKDLTLMRAATFTIRSQRTGTETFLKEVRAAIWSVNQDLPVYGEETLGMIYRRSMARTSFTLVMLSIAGAMALLLGVIGIYGVISYCVSQRTREVGIRMALGAQHREVKTMFVGHGLALVGIGVACGLIAAALLMRTLSVLLFRVEPADPLTYAVATAGLLVAATVASYVPARRATRMNPMRSLQAD